MFIVYAYIKKHILSNLNNKYIIKYVNTYSYSSTITFVNIMFV